jgi:hypothetical protein
MHRSEPFRCYLIASLLLTGCASLNTSAEWERHTIRLAEAGVSIVAPPSHFNVNLPSVDLATNRTPFIVLFQRAWAASGLVGDEGGVELQLFLSRHHARAPQQGFMEAVRVDYQTEVGRVFPGVELVNPRSRMIGGRQWACFDVTKLQVPDCVLELPDRQHYLVWRRTWVANTSARAPAKFIEMSERIERSIELAF